MKQTLFTGVATALITPLTDIWVDYNRLGELIDWQIEMGVDALVVCGTTGESATLDDAEHRQVIEYAVKRVDGRLPVIAGTGSNDTRYGVELTKHACDLGVDGLLTVTPYYNKATQTGLIRSFEAMADAATKPMILYNVPSRTGVNIEPKTAAKLSEHPNIVGIKEASGNISQIVELFSLVGDNMDVYSGNDDQIVPILSMGGKGVISVLSNPMPRETVEICRRWFNGDLKGSAELQCRYLPFIKALFSQVNPVPVKAAMARMGFCEDHLRLPLSPMEEPFRTNLYKCMDELGLPCAEGENK